LRGLLSGIAPGLDKPSAAELLRQLGCSENVRAEELGVATHVDLSNRIGGMHGRVTGI